MGATFLSGAIDGPITSATERHEDTRELIGKRIEYMYSDSERYEHVYLNERLFTWHCLAGAEQGLADTERCRYLKIVDRLYILRLAREDNSDAWGRAGGSSADEDDRQAIRLSGFDCGAVVNFPIGARVRLVSG